MDEFSGIKEDAKKTYNNARELSMCAGDHEVRVAKLEEVLAPGTQLLADNGLLERLGAVELEIMMLAVKAGDREKSSGADDRELTVVPEGLGSLASSDAAGPWLADKLWSLHGPSH